MLAQNTIYNRNELLKHPLEGGGKKKGGAVKAISCWLEGG